MAFAAFLLPVWYTTFPDDSQSPLGAQGPRCLSDGAWHPRSPSHLAQNPPPLWPSWKGGLRPAPPGRPHCPPPPQSSSPLDLCPMQVGDGPLGSAPASSKEVPFPLRAACAHTPSSPSSRGGPAGNPSVPTPRSSPQGWG